MKKILNFLGIITLIGTSITSLAACNTLKYTEEKLAELKKENKIKINNQEIRDNLEWMTSQEKSFKQVDNKWYFVVWRSEKGRDWRIVKFKNTTTDLIEINNFNNRQIEKGDLGMGKTLYIINLTGFIKYVTHWTKNDGIYFKGVYRWNGEGEPNMLIIDPKTGEVTDWKEDKEVKKDK